MSALTRFGKSVFRALEMAGRAKTLGHLESLSDRTLEDLGFSRALMRQGVSAWPWKIEQPVNSAQPATDSAAIEKAISELSAYNDHELADLGLSRGEIREAVIYGRQDTESNRAA